MKGIINRAFTEDSYKILNNLVGKRLVSIKHDGQSLNDATSLIQFNLEDSQVCLRTFTDVVDFYGAEEEITALEMENGPYGYEFPILSQFQIGKVIKSISIVTYQIHSTHDTDDIYDENVTAGLIMLLDDETQISFERADEFEEVIVVRSGEDSETFPFMDSYVRGFADSWKVTTTIETRELK